MTELTKHARVAVIGGGGLCLLVLLIIQRAYFISLLTDLLRQKLKL